MWRCGKPRAFRLLCHRDGVVKRHAATVSMVQLVSRGSARRTLAHSSVRTGSGLTDPCSLRSVRQTAGPIPDAHRQDEMSGAVQFVIAIEDFLGIVRLIWQIKVDQSMAMPCRCFERSITIAKYSETSCDLARPARLASKASLAMTSATQRFSQVMDSVKSAASLARSRLRMGSPSGATIGSTP